MNTRIQPLQALFLGAAPAAALGLLTGGLAHPVLAVDEPEPMQPAQVAYVSAPYEPPPSYASTPSYVLGTDWTSRHRVNLPVREIEPPPPYDEPAYVEQAAMDAGATEPAEPAPEPSYPSESGDILGGSDHAAPPPAEEPSPDV